jgi:hypothetical protein
LDVLEAWPIDRVIAATKAPIEFILPYTKILLNDAMQCHGKCRSKCLTTLEPNLAEFWTDHMFDEGEQYFEAYILAERLTRSSESLRNFAVCNCNSPPDSLRQVSMGPDTLINETSRLRDTLKDRLSRRAAIMSLEESRKSM